MKVRFAREFADVGSVTHSAPESLSSASSFHSLSSNLSTKSSSGICVDSAPHSPNETYNNSYINHSIAGVDDLILACKEIRLDTEPEKSHSPLQNSLDLSQDQTFSSATDETIDNITREVVSENSEEDYQNVIEVVENNTSLQSAVGVSFGTATSSDREDSIVKTEEFSQEHVSLEKHDSITHDSNVCGLVNNTEDTPLPHCESKDLNSTVSLSPNNSNLNVSEPEEAVSEEVSSIEAVSASNFVLNTTRNSVPSVSLVAENAEYPSLPSISTISSSAEDSSVKETASQSESVFHTAKENEKSDNFLISASTLSKTDLWPTIGTTLPESIIQEALEISPAKNVASVVEQQEEEQSSEEKLDVTLTFEDIPPNVDIPQDIEQYTDFKPQRQSTSLTLPKEQINFDDLRINRADDLHEIFKCSPEFTEETDRFVTATSEIFQDPTSFDFLLARTSSKNISRLRAESLYVKFDPLVSDVSMLPQGNTTQSISEEQNGKNETPLPNIGTPKRNPAIAAIDRLLFYSPLPSGAVQKTEEPKEKIEQPIEESTGDAPLIADINMSKELELVRATVLQLEEELEKQKKKYETELEKQKNTYQEKMNKLQAQLAEEVESKSHMTVVLEEYEKSISRMLTERERDRTNYEQEKTKLQEELQAANVHLTNTEAAFNDVHQKYERLKGVVSAYKSNESVLKESIQENMETIKGLETRYDQLKNHAMTQLEKANFELDAIKKQHEDETVKLHAMVRKAELKCNSLTELVEQKTKENRELARLLDEVIARVGHQNAD